MHTAVSEFKSSLRDLGGALWACCIWTPHPSASSSSNPVCALQRHCLMKATKPFGLSVSSLLSNLQWESTTCHVSWFSMKGLRKGLSASHSFGGWPQEASVREWVWDWRGRLWRRLSELGPAVAPGAATLMAALGDSREFAQRSPS